MLCNVRLNALFIVVWADYLCLHKINEDFNKGLCSQITTNFKTLHSFAIKQSVCLIAK